MIEINNLEINDENNSGQVPYANRMRHLIRNAIIYLHINLITINVITS